ncbi:hypothetical protein EK21DRAFT_63054, partial [Setomelanomma holmii]
YLIHLPSYARPYLTVLEFLALDFQNWGYTTTTHSDDSSYFKQIRQREKHLKL